MSARPTRARGRAAGRAPHMPVERFARVAALADRVAADWRALDDLGDWSGEGWSPKLRMALERHFAELDALFVGGVRLGHFARALQVRGVTVGKGVPVSRPAFGMVWLRLERRRDADLADRSAQGAPAEERREMAA